MHVRITLQEVSRPICTSYKISVYVGHFLPTSNLREYSLLKHKCSLAERTETGHRTSAARIGTHKHQTDTTHDEIRAADTQMEPARKRTSPKCDICEPAGLLRGHDKLPGEQRRDTVE